jgi:hypothetical protein
LKEEKGERNNKLMPVSPKAGNRVKVDFTILEIKNNNAEEGIECFSHWLSIEDGNSEDSNKNVQLTLTVFEREKNKLLIHDNFNNLDIEVVFTDGVPFCIKCDLDDCAHVGFAICAKQNILD